MVSNLAHTIRLYPTKTQETFFKKACGSGCGTVKETLLLSDREYICEVCGMVIDRDLNAAINLKNYGLNKLRAVSPEVTPVNKKALAISNNSETILVEAGISECPVMNT